MKNKEIYKEIKKRIIFLDYKPKQYLSIKDLAKEFGVSAIPIRELLVRLETEKLVRILPHKGIYVADISFQGFKDIFEVRLFLMGLVGRLVAQRITPEGLDKLKELLLKIKQEKDHHMLMRLDAEFHDLLNYYTKNETLTEIEEILRNQISRLWFFAQDSEIYFSHLPEIFEKLIKALENMDQNKCEEILKNHTLHFIEQIKASLYSE
jgi:DNA-binding GntR family transcriptional regulator